MGSEGLKALEEIRLPHTTVIVGQIRLYLSVRLLGGKKTFQC